VPAAASQARLRKALDGRWLKTTAWLQRSALADRNKKVRVVSASIGLYIKDGGSLEVSCEDFKMIISYRPDIPDMALATSCLLILGPTEGFKYLGTYMMYRDDDGGFQFLSKLSYSLLYSGSC
jgi:hypothetical protein